MRYLLLSLLSAFSVYIHAQTAYTSKYDYVPGAKIISSEDFSGTELGDFPAQWSTNATAEVVTLNGKPGKWLKINKEGVWFPGMMKELPENFTLDFDLGVNGGWNSLPFVVNITNLANAKEYTNYYHYVGWKGVHTIHLEFQPTRVDVRPGSAKLLAGRDGNHEVTQDVSYKTWDNASTNFAHISIWRQNKRLRVYLNGEKIWDVQEVFDPKSKYNAITFAMQGSYQLDDYYVFSNIRLAVGAPDTRNKLVKEGRWSTSGILFNSNSDEIQPESYGVLREVGMALKDSAYKVSIIGHTDGDGDAKANLELSKKRATAVKAYLVEKFGWKEENIEVIGKGAANPIDVNNTVSGKANNRRVEFVSLPITVKPGGIK